MSYSQMQSKGVNKDKKHESESDGSVETHMVRKSLTQPKGVRWLERK